MGLGLILFILVLLVFLTAFIVFIVKAGRQWGALHIVLLSILFIESWVFLYFAAGVQHERVRATRDAHRYTEEAQSAIARGNLLRFGAADAPYDSLEALIPVQGLLDRLTIDRGRVWRSLRFNNRRDKLIDLSFQANVSDTDFEGQQNSPQGQPVTAASLPENLIVYAFEEITDEQGYPLPVFYLGEFRVQKSDTISGEITLEATRPILSLHSARIDNGSDSWALYEMMPIDNHVAFSAPGSEPTGEAIFGRPEEDQIRQLLKGAPESVVNSYLRDGMRALDEDEDRPETIWVELRLLAEYQIDVDSDQSADATSGGYFDSTGRSIDDRLKRKEALNLNPAELRDNRIVVTEAVAKDLVDQNKAERVQKVFVRPLNDYFGLLNRYYARSFELEEKMVYYRYQSALIEQANKNGLDMLAQSQIENRELSDDLTNFKREIQFLSEANEASNESLQSLRQKLSRMYRVLQEYHQRLMLSSSSS
jgi:hypothetical protein